MRFDTRDLNKGGGGNFGRDTVLDKLPVPNKHTFHPKWHNMISTSPQYWPQQQNTATTEPEEEEYKSNLEDPGHTTRDPLPAQYD